MRLPWPSVPFVSIAGSATYHDTTRVACGRHQPIQSSRFRNATLEFPCRITYHASLRAPQGEGGGVLDYDTFTQDQRVRPGRAIGNGILPQRLKSLSTLLGHNQFGIVG